MTQKERGIETKEIEIPKEKSMTLLPVEQREFNVRMADITAESIMVEIGGRQKPVEGYSLHIENNKNPKPLKVNITKGDVFEKSGLLFIPKEGSIEISGEKEFDDLKRLEKSKGELTYMPVFDPDLVTIDQRTFKQTGTLYVKVTNARIVLNR